MKIRKFLKHFPYPYLLLLLMSVFTVMEVMADDIKTVEGEATFLGDGRHSPADCKRLAAEQARVKALGDAFGVLVTQNGNQTDWIKGGEEGTHFLSLTSTEVKGEWLGDIEEPKYEISLDTDGNLIVKCKVKGRAKPLSNKAADFEALVLRNGTDRRNADTSFVDQDQMYLYFSAPINGYLSVFLADEQENVFQLLPYSTGDVPEIKTKKGYDYIFFDPSRGNSFGNVDPLLMTADTMEEFNKIYVIFSPEPFSPPSVKFVYPGTPPSIDAEKFTEWLVKSRRNDDRMGVKTMNVRISPSGRKTEKLRF